METQTPRYDPELGRYVWEALVEESLPSIEPAFIKQAVTDNFERHDVTTFADTYPHGNRPQAKDPEPTEESFDALADWRVPGEVADNILISLPEGTPRMLRALLTLLLGGMRGGSKHS